METNLFRPQLAKKAAAALLNGRLPNVSHGNVEAAAALLECHDIGSFSPPSFQIVSLVLLPITLTIVHTLFFSFLTTVALDSSNCHSLSFMHL